MRADVAVVGGGPAGAVVAGLLAGDGARVILLDAARFPRRKACGECLNPGAVAALRRLGLWEAVAPLAPVALSGWTLSDGRRRFTASFPGGQVAYAVDRSRLDHALLTWVAARGVQVLEGVRVTGLLRRAGRSGTRVAGVTTRSGPVEAGFVVGADGLRSVVQRQLGLQAAPAARTAPKVAFTGHWAGLGAERRGELHFHGPLVCGIAPVGPDRANVTLVLPGPLARSVRPAGVAGLLARWPGGGGLGQRFAHARPLEPPLATGPFDQPVRAAAAPGALLAGDAAGYYDPLTGQGLYRALRSAELAAGALASGDLAAYDRRLRAEFAPAVRVQRLLDALVRRPALLGAGLGLLAACPPLGRWLIGLVGDCYHKEGADDHAEPRQESLHADL